MTGRRRLPFALLWAVLGCAAPETTGAPYTVRDSAGIRIVESQRPRLVGEAVWRLGSDPGTRIGGTSAVGLAALFQVSDATRLSDGTLVVANAGTQEVRFFTESGAPIRAVGGHGAGPGEFEALYRLARLPGDSVLVFDGLLGRATIFSGHGELAAVRTIEVESGGGYLFFRGHLEDGRLLAYRGWTSAQDTLPLRTRRYPTIRTLVLVGVGAPDTVGTFPGSERFVLVRDGRPTYTTAPFPHMRYELATQGRILLAQNDRFEVKRVALDGRLDEIVRRTASPQPIRDEHIDLFRSSRLDADDSPRNRRIVESIIEAVEMPEHLPLISDLLSDADGNLWVKSYEATGEARPTWSVFSPEGVWLTDVVVPPAGRVLEVGSTYLLGVWRDSLDVEELRLYHIVKPGV